jgi:hypothetical protein
MVTIASKMVLIRVSRVHGGWQGHHSGEDSLIALISNAGSENQAIVTAGVYFCSLKKYLD